MLRQNPGPRRLQVMCVIAFDLRLTTADALCKTAYRRRPVAWYNIIINQSEETKQNCAKTCDISIECTTVYEENVSKSEAANSVSRSLSPLVHSVVVVDHHDVRLFVLGVD